MADALQPARQGYAPDQPKLRGVALGAGAIVAAVIVAIVVAFLIVRHLPEDETAEKPRQPPAISGGPPLQPTPERDFPAFHAQKQRLLGEYAWVDRSKGVVRIPIDRAMALLVQQHAGTGSAATQAHP